MLFLPPFQVADAIILDIDPSAQLREIADAYANDKQNNPVDQRNKIKSDVHDAPRQGRFCLLIFFYGTFNAAGTFALRDSRTN